MASNHTFKQGTYNGIKLNIIETNASNIQLLNLENKKSLQDSAYFGINGGWFDYPGILLNITICDGYVVGARGNNNNWVGGGVLAWDGSQILSLSMVQNVDTIKNSVMGANKTGTWAQGGYSMWLGNSNWKEEVTKELFGSETARSIVFDGNPGRTAIVAKSGGGSFQG